MSEFALTTVFVVPSGTLASTGSTDALTPGQLGLYRPDYSVATAANIAAARYFYIAQGRKFLTPGVGSKRTDKITASKVSKWYKIVAEDTVANEIQTVSGFHVSCGETVHVQITAHSNLIDTIAYNGLVRTVSANAPCCDCGELPCADVSAPNTQALVDALAAKINAIPESSLDGSSQVVLSTYFTAYRTGTGATSVLNIASKPQPVYANAYDPTSYPYEFDRVWFTTVVFTNPDTTQDYYVADVCNVVGTVAVTQRSSYPRGTSAEILQLEKNFASYQTPYKNLYTDGSFNQGFETFVADGTFYDTYYIKFHPYGENISYNPALFMDTQIIVAFPTGTGTAFETALTAALGSPEDKSGADISTTTTTSTSSTTTTSTTYIIP